MKEGFWIGLIQGMTEFLPISSSGHIVLFSRLLSGREEAFPLALALHGATLLSLLTVFRSSFFRKQNFKDIDLTAKTCAALIPLVLAGLFF